MRRKKCTVCGSWNDGQCCAVIEVPPTLEESQNILGEVINENSELLSRLQKENSPGLKYDAGKPDLTIIPVEALNSIAACFEYGSKKYGRNNFKKGMRWSRVMGALLRHAYAYASGQKLDPESGLSHLSHVGSCICMLLYFETTGAGTNDLTEQID